MNIKNYTSVIPAYQSMGKIEKCLVQAGATDISKKYLNGVCDAVTFRMIINNQPIFFKMPAKVDLCFEVLWKEVKRPRDDTRERVIKQAEKTAWKIVCDWVEIQLSMITLKQAEALELFLPYAYNPATDKTLYTQIKESGYKALLT